jgi:hypothetical protein
VPPPPWADPECLCPVPCLHKGEEPGTAHEEMAPRGPGRPAGASRVQPLYTCSRGSSSDQGAVEGVVGLATGAAWGWDPWTHSAVDLAATHDIVQEGVDPVELPGNGVSRVHLGPHPPGNRPRTGACEGL